MYYIVINSNAMIMTLKFLEKEYNKGKVYARKNNKKKENTKREINENQIFVSLFFKN